MDAEKVLSLFDSFWFEREIFKKPHPSPVDSQHSDGENQEKPLKLSPETFSRVPSNHTRSMSEDLRSFISGSDSGLFSPKLHTILSSKDIAEPPENSRKERRELKQASRNRARGRRRGCGSKSLSELEFEEVKGFMDLGFVFCEEDRESGLATIIPGLNRLGRRDEGCEVSRPYLSEAWEGLEREKEEKPLMMNWRFPALRNEMDMKDNLRWWAHTVASTVR